ncbi:uncharacterized protein LOC130799260 [Amaranthus tricolor]|uniref:uncharacterized protein LOC130799260 n=1 Tax=Amaranthus tricolor TaxID=29722 RepID=UPI0025874849|nr:uncharacterized protein LOC130799260 [Amaranthus tricolor]
MTEPFLDKIGLHQGSALSPFIFTVIMEEISESIWEKVPWYMLFADDIVLVAETKEEFSNKLDEWRKVLKVGHCRLASQRCPLVKMLLRVRPTTDIWDRSFRVMGRLAKMSIIKYMQVDSGGEQPPGCYVIESFQAT